MESTSKEITPRGSGRVYWITGLARSGKSTTAQWLFNRLRDHKPNVVLLDGDDLRAAYGDNLGHNVADRRILALRNARMCRLLSIQGIDVVCATICLFHECHNWCRTNISRYYEIYLRVPLKELRRRDLSGLYDRAISGEVQNVVGVDIHPEEPLNPDLVIENEGQLYPLDVAELVWQFVSTIENGDDCAS